MFLDIQLNIHMMFWNLFPKKKTLKRKMAVFLIEYSISPQRIAHRVPAWVLTFLAFRLQFRIKSLDSSRSQVRIHRIPSHLSPRFPVFIFFGSRAHQEKKKGKEGRGRKRKKKREGICGVFLINSMTISLLNFIIIMIFFLKFPRLSSSIS